MTSIAALEADSPVDVGRVIAGKYRLECLLGEGGMGAVWRAFHLQLEVPVALKLLRGGENMSELRERMHVEGRAVAKLVHPNIVRVFDIGEAETGEPFIVMELLNGESLAAILERGALSPVSALQLLLPIAEALTLAHSRGVVHRDLKPDNILIATEGSVVQPKLLDFGIAKVRSALAGGAPALTQTGMLLGSPDYMSPEQAHGRADIDERSDVWAFCVVLYEALAGRTPFERESCQATLRSVAYDEALPLLAVADVEPELSQLVQRGLAKEREQRPASMFELGRALAVWLWQHGVYEDATGCSLEAKWLARSTDGPSCATYEPDEQRWAYEQATLVSVAHPGLRPGSGDPVTFVPARRVRRWGPSAVVVAGALLGCLAWAGLHPRELLGTRATAFTSRAPAPVATAPAAPAPAPSEPSEAVFAPAVLAVETLPVLPAPPLPPRVVAVANSKSVASASSLPEALPRRETPGDLLQPY